MAPKTKPVGETPSAVRGPAFWVLLLGSTLVLQSGCQYKFYSGPRVDGGFADGQVDGGPDAESDGQPIADGAPDDGAPDDGGGPVCGNGTQEGDEECDDGNTTNGDGCSADCRIETPCGNGVLDPGETCDDGNRKNTDDCPDDGAHGGTCEPASCGDGFVWAGHEDCDGPNLNHETCQRNGYLSGSLSCTADACVFDFSGCSDPGWYLWEDFETSSVNDWTLQNDWEVGTPSAGNEPDPYSGTQCAGTVIGGDYHNGNTWNGTTMTSPPVDLSGASDPVLLFWQYVDSDMHMAGGNIKISTNDGSSWITLENNVLDPDYYEEWISGGQDAYTGDYAGRGWHLVTADLSAFVGETLLVRFAFYSENYGGMTDPGWYIDDVLVTESVLVPVEMDTPLELGYAAIDSPFSRTLKATGGSGSYHWTIEGGINHQWLSIEWTTGRVFGTPSAAHVGPVELIVRAEDATLAGNYKQQTFTVEVSAAATLPLEWDFEGGMEAGWFINGDWQHGAPSPMGGGPSSCYDGNGCIATNIDGFYSLSLSYDGCSAVLPPIDLSATTQPTLVFRHFYATAPEDGGNIQISVDGGHTFNVLPDPIPAYNETVGGLDAYAGYEYEYTNQWERVMVDLSNYIGQTVVLRFSFFSDDQSWGDMPGWYIDEVEVCEAADVAWLLTGNSDLGFIPQDESFSRQLTAIGASSNPVWTIEGGTNHGWLSIDSGSGELNGTPSLSNNGAGSVTVRITDGANAQNYTEETYTFEVVKAIVHASFDGAQPSDWTPVSDWSWGTPNHFSGIPPACFSGSCWATGMSTDYGNNRNYDGCYLESPPIDLASTTAPTLVYYQYVMTEPSADGGHLEILAPSASGWELLGNSVIDPDYGFSMIGGAPAYSGDQSMEGWYPVTVDLSAYAGETISIRFAFYSDSSVTMPGWYIDEFIIFD
jgi:cysteine-rich repeat protein